MKISLSPVFDSHNSYPERDTIEFEEWLDNQINIIIKYGGGPDRELTIDKKDFVRILKFFDNGE